MPFESEAQRRFMYSQHPELAKEFEKATPKGADLPEHVKKMADGGSTVSVDKDEPGMQDASVSDFLAPYLLGPAAKGISEEIPEALEGLSGKLANETGAVNGDLASKLTRYSKGVMGKGTPNEVEIQNVKGAPEDIAKLGFGTDPASIPSHILDAHGIPWEDAEPAGATPSASNPTPESQNPTAPFAADLRQLWADAAKEQSGTPISIRAPYERPDVVQPAQGMAEGGKVDYPHVTFMEDQTPEGVKETTHLAKSHEEPKMAEGGFLGDLKKGALHKEMGIPESSTIPAKKLDKAANSDNETLRKRAQFAINAKKWHHVAEGGVVPHEKKLADIYKAMGIKKYADGGTPDVGDVDASQLPGGVPPPPPANDPGFMDWVKTFGSKLINSPAASIAGLVTNPMSALSNAASTVAPAGATAAAPAISNIENKLSGGAIPAAAETPAPAAPITPVTPPALPASPAPSMAASAAPVTSTTAGMPNIGQIFNQDTSKLTAGSNPEDRQALIDKLQTQQHGLGAVIAQAVAGLGDALSAKGGKETHALGNIFTMNTQQRQEALDNFDKMRQDKMQKLQLQTQMGDNALKQAAAADAYGSDEHLNSLLGAPKGTMKKDLPNYLGMMSAQIAAKEKDEDLYMKSHAQAGLDVDNAIKNSSILGIKPSPAQLQASGAKLADQYYNRAKGNILVKPSDGGAAQWLPAQNLGKAKQMDPNLTVQQ